MKRKLIVGIILAMIASIFMPLGQVKANSQFNTLDCNWQTPLTGAGASIAGSVCYGSTPGIIFTKQNNNAITGLTVKVGKIGTLGPTYSVGLYTVGTVDGYQVPININSPLAIVTLNTSNITNGPAWIDIPLVYAAATAGTKYAVLMSVVGTWGDPSDSIYWYGCTGTLSAPVYSLGWYVCNTGPYPNFQPTDYMLDFGIYSGYVPSPKVNTLNETMDTNNITFNGEVLQFGDDSTVSTGFQYGTVSGGPYPNSVEGNNAAYNNGKPIIFSAFIPTNSVPVNTTIYYRAIMIGTTDGETDGPEYSFEVTPQLLANGSVETLPAKKVSYNTAELGGELYSLGTDSSVNLVIYYGTDPSLSASPITVQSGAVQLGEYDEAVSGLTSNTTYYFQFASIGTNDGTTKGSILSFKTWDTSKASGVNKVNQWLDAMGWGPGVWWVFLAFLAAIVWLIPGVREHSIIGIVLDALIIGGGIVMVLDPWVVIVLAVIAGAIIAVVMIKNRGD